MDEELFRLSMGAVENEKSYNRSREEDSWFWFKLAEENYEALMEERENGEDC